MYTLEEVGEKNSGSLVSASAKLRARLYGAYGIPCVPDNSKTTYKKRALRALFLFFKRSGGIGVVLTTTS